MPATALDSIIFRDIFSTPEMRAVFSDENRTACYLEIEGALARVQGRLGISNGRLTLVLEPATANGGWIGLTRLDENRLAGTGTARIRWEPQGPVELIRQPQGPAANPPA